LAPNDPDVTIVNPATFVSQMIQVQFMWKRPRFGVDSQERNTMKRFLMTATALALLAGTGGAFAQPHRDDHHDDHRPGPAAAMHGPQHNWHQGGKIERNDWNRGTRVDYRRNHLRQPPRGYEWRQVDGNYVLAAAATGLIASIMLANH
jgi:Ni/Co efflux regulator RcnB